MHCSAKKSEDEFAPGKIACVVTGLSIDYASTHKLYVMRYDQGMSEPNSNEWTKAVNEEFERMKKHKV